jgi:hypothetical protein
MRLTQKQMFLETPQSTSFATGIEAQHSMRAAGIETLAVGNEMQRCGKAGRQKRISADVVVQESQI